ncbi:MAG TPA: amidase [Sporolactobacillaceae bacterium]|nr:amidase [Sporolactobacillaceae bacterium]
MDLSLSQLAKKIQSKEVSPVEIVETVLKEIEEKNPSLNAFLTVAKTAALDAAMRAEEDIASGNYKGPLHGVPIGLKDLIETKGLKTTMGSKLFRDYLPEKDAVVVEHLKEAGAIILGKLHTHEFAYGPVGDRSYFGPARNPHNPEKITGGSSSGAGAAVAAHLAFAGIGTDTGGSVRIPSAACGVVGMKPTVGKVSKEGVFPLSYTLDHVGPLTRTVLDNALVLDVLSGEKPADLSDLETAFQQFTLHGLKVGLPEAYFLEDLDPEVDQAFKASIALLEEAGAQIQPVNIPNLDQILWAQSVVQSSEAYEIHEKWLETRGTEYDPEVYERLLDSKETRGFEYVKAMRLRDSLIEGVNALFNKVDVLITPTLPILPTDIDQRDVVINGKTLNVRGALLKNTRPWNYTGHPALSVPNGWSTSGLPIGLQLIGPYFSENLLYKIGQKLLIT